MKHVNRKEFLETKIYLPPLEEQRRIAAILDKADGVRRKHKEAIRLTEELLKSTFLEMFGDPENSVYPVKTLNDVCSKITDGAHFTPTYTSTGVPFLRVTDIQNDFIDWENVKHIPIEEHKELIKRCHPKRGDILYSKNGTIGIPKIIDWDNDFSIFVSLALLSPKKEIILSDFLESFLRTPFALRQALSHTKTGTVSNLHLVEIRKVKLPVPDIHIQEQWILYKSEIHKMRNQLSGAFDESENLFNSLLQRAFRGEL
jgi:type I restriction enzyme S subunit